MWYQQCVLGLFLLGNQIYDRCGPQAGRTLSVIGDAVFAFCMSEYWSLAEVISYDCQTSVVGD